MKSNNSNCIFTKSKYFLLLPVVVVMLALIVFIIFSYNSGDDLKNYYMYNVNYKTEISDTDYRDAANLIKNKLYNKYGNSIKVVTSKINEDIDVLTNVKIFINDDLENFETTLAEINQDIENSLNVLIDNGHVSVEESTHVVGQKINQDILWTGIALLVVMAISFVYFLIRFELKTALTSLVFVPFVSLMLSALTVLFRLPISNLFTIPFIISALIAYIMFMILSDKVRNILNNDDYNGLTNTQVVTKALNEVKNRFCYIIFAMSFLYLFNIFFFNTKLFIFAISGLLGIILAVYSVIVIASIVWTSLYKREKDNRLKEYKEREKAQKKEGKKKKTKEEEEKILV